MRNFQPAAVLGVALLACVAALADDPPAPRTIPGWGTVIDPDGDCKIVRDQKTLIVEAPGTAHDLSAELQKMNAPRVVHDVKGDFILQATIGAALQPTPPSTIPERTPYNGAGLLLYDDADSYVRLERAAIERGGRIVSYVNFELRDDGRHEVHAVGYELEGDWHLRLERHGDQVQAMIGPDGVQWVALRPFKLAAPKSSKVGVAVCNSSSTPFAANFEGLGLFTRAAASASGTAATADGSDED